MSTAKEPSLGKIYSFKYLWSNQVHVGVLAQEVLEQNPEAKLDQLIRSQSIEIEVEEAATSKVKTNRPRPTAATTVEEDDLASFEL